MEVAKSLGTALGAADRNHNCRVLRSRIGIFACLDAMPASPRCIRLHHRRALLMTVINQGRYAMVPLPDPKLGPRKVDVASMYNAERCRPRYDHKLGLRILLTRPVMGDSHTLPWRESLTSGPDSGTLAA